MSKKDESSWGTAMLMAAVGAVAVLFVPFMAAGLVVGSAVSLARELANTGNPLGSIVVAAYQPFLASDAIDLGKVAVVYVVAPFVARWGMLVAGYLGVYAGSGWLWHAFMPALTPWPNVDSFAIPALIGLVQAGIVQVLFPGADTLPQGLSRFSFLITVAYCWIGPIVVVALAWFYWALVWLLS